MKTPKSPMMGYPRLSDQFFQDKRPSREFFAKWKTQGAWSSDLLPIYEWQGILYVAVHDNASALKVQGEWCIVQARAELLSELWSEWQDSPPIAVAPVTEELVLQETPTPAEAAAIVPEELDLNAQEDVARPEAVPMISLESMQTSELYLKEETTPEPSTISNLPNPHGAPAIAKMPAKDDWTPFWDSILFCYQHAMILQFTEGNAVPWLWDHKLTAPEKVHGYSTQKPSPFRIVARTQKSYHGYIVPSDTIEAFFQDWNHRDVPAHLTLSPIIHGEVLIGFLMAWGTSTSDTKETLHLVEKSADDLAALLRARPDLFKKAA